MRASAMVTVGAALLCLSAGRRDAAAQTVVAKAENETEVVWLEPRQLMKVVDGNNYTIQWFTVLPEVVSVTAQVEDERVARVELVGPVIQGLEGDNFTFTGDINVSTNFLGYNTLHVLLYDGQGAVAGKAEMPMSVLLSYQNLSDAFMYLTSVLVALLYVIMGATLNLEVIKAIFKKPLGPLVGIVCQYIFMPLIAFGLAKATFPNNPLGQLGLFLSGSCPGGGASNMWTHLLGGSLDLSIMMTFISTVVAFASVPLWVLLMGPIIVGDTDFVIPYTDITMLVISLSIPCAIGMLIAKFLPRVAAVLNKMLTPFTLFNVVILFTFGVYANRYVFSLFDVSTMAAGFGLPMLGYLSGLCLASILRLPIKDRIAISIETGIQNMIIAVIILKLSLEAPASELTIAYPAAASVMTPIPLVVALITRRLYLRCCSSQNDENKPINTNTKATSEKAKADEDEKETGEGKAETDGGKETDTEKLERNGRAAVGERGLDNPAVEVEDTF